MVKQSKFRFLVCYRAAGPGFDVNGDSRVILGRKRHMRTLAGDHAAREVIRRQLAQEFSLEPETIKISIYSWIQL